MIPAAPELRTFDELLSDCVHCGFCLPACPTYVSWGNEMDSPRGRIDLMKGLHDGVIDLTGTPEAPAKVGISVADIASGMYAFSSILAALYQRRATGRGAEIQISMLESLVEWVMPADLAAFWQVTA